MCLGLRKKECNVSTHRLETQFKFTSFTGATTCEATSILMLGVAGIAMNHGTNAL